MSEVYILDTETTGTYKKDQVIELAYLRLELLESELNSYQTLSLINFKDTFLSNVISERFFPSVEIEQRAFECHGIKRISLKGHRSSRFVDIPQDVEYLIGHNIIFDIRLLSQSNTAIADRLAGIKLIDTLPLARTLNQHRDLGFTAHSLDYLVEQFFTEDKDLFLTEYHSAGMDILKTLLVLLKLVEPMENIRTWEDLYTLQTTLKGVKKK